MTGMATQVVIWYLSLHLEIYKNFYSTTTPNILEIAT